MEHKQTTLDNQTFYPARNSGTQRKMLLGLWSGLGLGALMWLLRSGDIAKELTSPPFWIFIGIMALLCLAMHAYLTSQSNPKQPVAILTANALESQRLMGKVKRLPWTEIETVSVMRQQGQAYLQFAIRESSPIHEQRGFWGTMFGRGISLPLSGLDEPEQAQLLGAINTRLHLHQGGNPDTPLPNELEEERAFHQKLKSLGPTPWVTWALIATNIVVWIGVSLSVGNFMQTPADKLLAVGGNAASAVQNGEWWRLLSALFLHGGFMHVAMNMLGLYSVGMLLERIYGPRLFAIIYLGSGLVGSALSLSYAAQTAVSVGASGAVFGATGALLVALFQHRDTVPKALGKSNISGLAFFILYSLLQGFTHAGIDNAAHIGGLVSGCILAAILPGRLDMERFLSTQSTRAPVAIIAVLLATAGLALIAPPAALDQQHIFASNSLVTQAFQAFEDGAKALKKESEDLRDGKLTEREVDDRSRTVFAPQFRHISDLLAEVKLRPGDPREAVLEDVRTITALMIETLAMEASFPDGGGKPVPADPERSAQIEKELAQAGERFATDMAELKALAAKQKAKAP
ncbi:MAG: rhomboid family intramembrane serine protease [Rhodocyclaceae bacterium]|nr:rhomboid family intramembrane serine protease [Rhodocyclaceae bacterium]